MCLSSVVTNIIGEIDFSDFSKVQGPAGQWWTRILPNRPSNPGQSQPTEILSKLWVSPSYEARHQFVCSSLVTNIRIFELFKQKFHFKIESFFQNSFVEYYSYSDENEYCWYKTDFYHFRSTFDELKSAMTFRIIYYIHIMYPCIHSILTWQLTTAFQLKQQPGLRNHPD